MFMKDALAAMQANFSKARPFDIRLKWPRWLRPTNPIAAVYREKSTLLSNGNVYFAHIVQANSALFKRFPLSDHPAQIVFSTDPYVEEVPQLLRDVAHIFYQYKGQPAENIPEQFREIARVLTDEHDSSSFGFTVTSKGRPVDVQFIPTMIFRKLLPKGKLCGSFLPIIVDENCGSILVLPKRYWDKEFKKLWIQGKL